MKSSEDTSSSGSCTSSLFRSESERTSRIVRERSRVDKFYIVKYVPLRERKLLTKLLKTRVIFDDIKNKLLSSSNISDDEKANLSRGLNVEPRHLSGFCSCCSCSTDFSIQGRTNKIGRHYENIYQPGATGKLRINTNYPAANTRRQGSHITHGSGEYAKSRSSILKIKKHKAFPVTHSRDKSVRLNSKDIRSTPCLCPFKLNDVIKNESKVVLRKKKKAHNPELHNPLIHNGTEEENQRKSLKNIKEKKLSLKYYQKLKYSKSRIKSNLEERSQKYTRKIKQNKETSQDGAKKSCNKALEYDGKLFAGDIEIPAKNKNQASIENAKDDSGLKFNENLLQKQEWKCEHEYDSEECDLEECLEIILLNKVRRAMCDNEIQTDKKSTTSAQVQGSEIINVAAPDPKISINIGPKKKENLLSWQNKIKSSIPVDKQRNIKSMTNVQTTGSTNLIRAASTGTVHTMENEIKIKPQGTIVPKLKQHQVLQPRTTSSDSLPKSQPRLRFTSPDGLKLKQNRTKIEPRIIDIKMKPSNITNKENIIKSQRTTLETKLKQTKYFKVGRFSLKRCFCALKLKAKRNQNISKRAVGKSITSQKLEKLKKYENLQFFNKIRQYECEPSFCAPGKCNPIECERQLRNRNIHDSVQFDTDYPRRAISDSTKFTSNTILDKKIMNLQGPVKDRNVTAGIIEKNHIFLNLRRYIGKLKLRKSTNKKNVKVQSISKVFLRNSAVQLPNLYGDTFSKLTLKYTEKRLNTECRKAKSTLSMTSSTHVPVNIKTAKSTLPAYKISPTLKLKKQVVIKQVPKEVLRKCISLDPNLLMNKTPLLLNAPTKKSKQNVRERGCQGDAKLEKRSVFIQVDKQRKAQIGTVLKRCFCTLKFSNRIKNEKSLKKNKIVGTEPTTIKNFYTKNIETSTSTPKLISSSKIIKTARSSGMGTETNKLNDAFTKASKSISNIEKITLSDELIDTNLRQAVRFESNFSFDIEFCKNYSHEVRNTCSKKQDKTCVPKSSCINKIKKVFGMLQKCSCTINRFKQTKYITDTKVITPVGRIKIQPNVYTVRRVAITDNKIGDQLSSLHNYGDTTYEDDKISILKQKYLVGESPTKSITIKPNKQNTRRKWVIQNKKYIAFNKKKRYGTIIRQSGFQNEKVYKKSSFLHRNHSKITGFSSYSKRCYCTMNVQAQRDNRKKHKLLDYECEPGVCDPYPGECDPNVCIQLINKRLKKSKMAGTGTRRPVSSSSQSTTSSQERKLQSSVPHRAQKTRANRNGGELRYSGTQDTQGIQYKTAPSSPRRQMVRVGSSFSFNIEFAKDKAQSKQRPEPVERVTKPDNIQKEKAKKQKNMGTKGIKSDRNSRDSQSSILMADKGSSGAPGLKRCFCTLKLHKKAKDMKVTTHANQRTMTPPDKRKIIVRANAAQNTKSYKPRPVLDPHECEPNICIPGECDPYECLERIKKRNKKYQSKGTESIGSRSTSSGTGPKRHGREQKVQSNKYRERKARGSTVSLEERPSRPVTKFAPTDRQVVRIGSSFSFNIEFYKDRTPNADHIQAAAAAVKRAKKEKPIKIPKTNKGFGVDKKLQSRDSQVYGTKMENRGTGMLKRCFCTLKLHKKGKFPIDEKQIIKVNTQGTKARRVKEPATMYERGATANDKTELLPYECEPGICVPGQCDPYKCYKRIQRRLREAGITTGRHDMKTASSMSSSALKAKKMQHGGRQKTHGKPTQARSNVEKQKRNKQAVRLGSDFSFNIEFYKDRYYDSSTAIKPPKTQYEKLHYAKQKLAPKAKGRTGSSQDQRSIHSTDSQVGKVMKNVGSTVTSLKRCFCTLSLKKPNQGPVIVNRLTNVNTIPQHFKQRKSRTLNPETPVTIINRMDKLEPYECEPNFCIPGECNPLVCLERIKRRQKKNSGTITSSPGIKSVGSTGSISSNKGKGIQHKSHGKTKASMKTSKIAKDYTASSGSNKQAVRIGSNFSFDVEFCKGKSHGDGAGAPKKMSPKIYKEKIGTRKMDASKSTDHNQKIKNKNIQKQKNVRDMDSQVLEKKMQSAMSGVSPLLKRCFCTLKLHSAKNTKIKPEIKKLKKPSPEQKKTSIKENNLKSQKNEKLETTKNSKVGTKGKEIKVIQPSPTSTKATRTAPVKYEKYPQKLEPYECEPGVCIPGDCDPYECEKRIRRKEMQSKMAGTGGEKKNRRSVSSITAGVRRAKGGQTKYQTEEGIDSQTGNTESYVIEHSRFKSTGSPHRQAVRISSSFSFNVEFYKDSSPNFSNQVKPGEAGDSTKQIMHHGNTDLKKMKNKNACSQAMCRDKGVCKQGICLRNRGLQAKGPRTESRGSGVGPMLKRCFCTLKLQKKGRHGQKTVTKDNKKEIMDKKANNDQIDKRDKKLKTANIGVSTKKKFGKLEPYECEPGICVPGECDPYECQKMIKLRNVKNLGTETSPGYKSTRACTAPCAKRTDRKVQSAAAKSQKDRRATAIPPKPIPRELRSYTTSVRDDSGRQAVRIGSSFSFEIELFKDRSFDSGSVTIPKQKEIKHFPKEEKKLQSLQTTTVNRGCDSIKCQAKSQITGANNDSKGTGMGPALKRCFCTLKLQKSPNELQKHTKSKENRNKLKLEQTPQVETHDKKVATKKIKLYELSPYECEPYTCIPGQCDPYECLERIKKRNLRTAATVTKPFSQVQASCTAGTCPKSKKLQSSMNDNNRIKQTQATATMKPVTLVEQPRFTKINTNRQAVKIGSNFKFDIEFFKDSSLGHDIEGGRKNDTHIYKRDAGDNTNEKATKNKGMKNKSGNSKTCPTQAECLRTINQASGGNKILKRCFCTLKLQKQGNKGMRKAMTVQRVAVQYNRSIPYRHRRVKKTMKKKSANKNVLSSYPDMNTYACYPCKNCRKLNNTNWETDNNKIITLFPYIPHKFHNAVSKTVMVHINKKNKRSCSSYKEKNSGFNLGFKCSRACLQKNKLPKSIKKYQNFYEKNIKTDNKGIHKEENFEKCSGIGINIKNFFRHFKEIFIKSHSSKKKTSISYPAKKQSLDVHLLKKFIINYSNSTVQSKSSDTIFNPKVSKSIKLGNITETKNDCVYNSTYSIKAMEKKPRFQPEDANITQRTICVLQDKETKNVSFNDDISFDHCQINQSQENRFLEKNKFSYEDNKVVQQALVSYKNLNCCGYDICGIEGNIFCPCSIEKNGVNKYQSTEMVLKKNKKNCAELIEHSLKPGILKKSKEKGNIALRKDKHNIDTAMLTTKTNILHRPLFTVRSSICQTKKVKFRKDSDHRIPSERKREKYKQEVKKFNRKSKSVTELTKPQGVKLYKKKSVPSKTNKFQCKSRKPCPCCPGNKDKNLALAGGDQISQSGKRNLLKKSCVKECETKNLGDIKSMRCTNLKKIKKRLSKSTDKCNEDPFFEMKLHSKNMTILNEDDVFYKIMELKSKKYDKLSPGKLEELHGKSCRCCVCQSVKLGRQRLPGGLPARLRSTKSCICGSAKCAENFETKAISKNKKKTPPKRKPCICGTKICTMEALKMDLQNQIISKNQATQLRKNLKNETLTKKKIKKKTQDKLNYAMRQKKYKKEDLLRKKERDKADKIANRHVEKYINSSDTLLLAESAIDIAKLGINAVTSSLKCMFKAVLNPKHTYRNLRTGVQDPQRLLTNMKNVWSDSGVVSTARRVKRRFRSMRCVNSVASKLKDNTVTKYLLHVCDSNPKARLRRKRWVRRREPVNFQCSLYMASLRKKPWLFVYYLCPWFYPHCISMLNIWRQFTDVMLFLLAVFVWSPCILAMEACRACMCCTLCTG